MNDTYLNQQGFSLTSMLVAIAMSTVLMSALLSMSKNTINTQKSMGTIGEFDDARRQLMNFVSCEQTLSAQPGDGLDCDNGTPIALKDKKNKTLVAEPYGTKWGLTLRATCHNGLGIRVEAAKFKRDKYPTLNGSNEWLNAASDYVVDASLKLPYDLYHPRATIFGADGKRNALCSAGKRTMGTPPSIATPTGPPPTGASAGQKCISKSAQFTQRGPLSGGGVYVYSGPDRLGPTSVTLTCPADYPVLVGGQGGATTCMYEELSGFKWIEGPGGYPNAVTCKIMDQYAKYMSDSTSYEATCYNFCFNNPPCENVLVPPGEQRMAAICQATCCQL